MRAIHRQYIILTAFIVFIDTWTLLHLNQMLSRHPHTMDGLSILTTTWIWLTVLYFTVTKYKNKPDPELTLRNYLRLQNALTLAGIGFALWMGSSLRL